MTVSSQRLRATQTKYLFSSGVELSDPSSAVYCKNALWDTIKDRLGKYLVFAHVRSLHSISLPSEVDPPRYTLDALSSGTRNGII